MLGLELVLVLEQAPVLELVRVLVLEQALGQVPVLEQGLHKQRPPVRLAGSLSLPKKITFYSI